MFNKEIKILKINYFFRISVLHYPLASLCLTTLNIF